MKSIKKNTVLNVIKTLASIIFPLITLPYVSRVLLPDNVGKVNFAISLVGYFALIASLGISTYAIRECSKIKEDKEALSETASQIFSINLITTFLAYILLALALLVFRSLDSYRYLIIIYATTIVFTTIGMDWLNSSMEDFLYISIRTILFQVISLVLLFVFVKSQDDYYKYIAITAFSSGGANVANFFYRKKYCSVRFTIHVDWKRHLAPILLLFVMSLSQIIFNNADVTMLGLMKGDFEVGIYSTAHKITNVISQVVQSIIYVMIPRLSLLFAKEDYNEINVLLRKLIQFNIGLGFPITVGVVMLSNDIVYIVGGTEYLDAAPVMCILILAFFFSLVGGSFLGNAILIPSGNERYYMIVCCITAAINVVLNFALIPLLGAVGAAISTAFNGLLILVLLWIKKDKRIKIDRKISVFLGPIVGCVIIALICLACYLISTLWIRVVVSVCASVFMYFLVLLIFRYDLLIETIHGFLNKMKRRF